MNNYPMDLRTTKHDQAIHTYFVCEKLTQEQIEAAARRDHKRDANKRLRDISGQTTEVEAERKRKNPKSPAPYVRTQEDLDAWKLAIEINEFTYDVAVEAAKERKTRTPANPVDLVIQAYEGKTELEIMAAIYARAHNLTFDEFEWDSEQCKFVTVVMDEDDVDEDES